MEDVENKKVGVEEIIRTADEKRKAADEERKRQASEKEAIAKRAFARYLTLLAQEGVVGGLQEPEAQEPKKKEAARPARRGRRLLERDQRLEFRVTEQELVALRERIQQCGCSQGEYLRAVALRGQIVVRPTPKLAEVTASDAVRAELGRIGGLLKSTIRPNEGSANITREEWQMVFAAIRDIERLTAQLRKLLADAGRDEPC